MLNAIRLRSFLIGAGVMTLAPFTFGQVPIDESVGELPVLDVVESADLAAEDIQADVQVNMSAQLYLQLQRLQSEVQMLRGQVEEQGQLIRQLEQQRFEDFVALDQRLVSIEGGAVAVVAEESNLPDDTNSNRVDNNFQSNSDGFSAGQNQVNEAEAKVAYDAAYAILRQGDFSGSKAAFNDFLLAFPTSDYAANAYYWLGELAINDGELEIARQRFMAVVNNFPGHRKINDAYYKLGTVYYQLGQMGQSKEFFERAVMGTGQASTLARKALEENF